MPVDVYVWRKDKDRELVGHASLRIGGIYVSFWPEDTAGKKDVTIKSSHAPLFEEKFEADVRSEGNRQPQQVMLVGLDERVMIIHHNYLSKRLKQRYNVLNMNCASYAAGLLYVGSAMAPDFAPSVDPAGYGGPITELASRLFLFARNIFGSKRVIWTPELLYRYALELKHRDWRQNLRIQQTIGARRRSPADKPWSFSGQAARAPR